MSRPDASVVIPSRNRATMVSGAISSALAQRDVNIEVIVVDDASTDETRAVLGQISDDRVQVVRQSEPRGVSAARNAGLAHARADWIAFLDDDDLWAPNWLATAIQAGRRSEAGLVYGGCWLINADRRVIGAWPGADVRGVPDSLALSNSVGVPASVIVRADVLRTSGGFDESLSAFADWEAWIRILTATSAAEVGELLVAYTIYPGNMVARDPFGVAAELERFIDVASTRSQFAVQKTPVLRWIADGCERGGARDAAMRLWWRAFQSSHNGMDLVRWLQAVIRPRLELSPLTYAAPQWLRVDLPAFRQLGSSVRVDPG